MALQHVIRHSAIMPSSRCHQFAQLTTKPVLQHVSSVHLACYHQLSKYFFNKKTHLSCCFHNGYRKQSKFHQANLTTVGHTAATEKSYLNILPREAPKHLSLSPMKNSLLINTFSTSSFKGAGEDIGKTTSSKQPFFDFFSVKSLLSTPTPYMLYGISGLIPFISVPIYMFMTSTYCASLAHAQLAYGACILSFLGGVAWGKDLNNPQQSTYKSLGYSVLLPLVGWVGVLVYPSVTAFPIVMAGVAFAGYIDTQTMNYSQWFKNLRFLLSSLVLVSMTSTYLLRLCS